MLKKFTVKNYKNFKDEISLDFSKIGEYSFNMDSLSMRLIYGRNATGKTNFGRALLNIKSLLCGMQSRGLINADSQEDTAKFIYEFKFGNDEVIYKYRAEGDGNDIGKHYSSPSFSAFSASSFFLADFVSAYCITAMSTPSARKPPKGRLSMEAP